MHTSINTYNLLDRLATQHTGVPIYVQLREQILHAIGDGTLVPGDRLPTMRQVAVALKVDLNTVQRAYASLEREGVLSASRGRGTFVANPAPQLDPAMRDTAIEALVHKTIASAKSLGLDPVEVGEAIIAKTGTRSDAPSGENP
jgi:GntR family transcriptional regulator